MDPDQALANYRRAIEDGDEDDAFDAADALVGWLNRGGFKPKGLDAAELKRIRKTFVTGYKRVYGAGAFTGYKRVYGAGAFFGAGAADPNADPKSAYDAGVEDGYNAKKNGEAYDPGYGAEYFSDPTEIEAANAGYAAGFAAAVTGTPKPTSTTLTPAEAAKKIVAPPKPTPAAPASSGDSSGWLWLLLLLGGGYYLTRGR